MDDPTMASNNSISTAATAPSSCSTGTRNKWFPKKLFIYISPNTSETRLRASFSDYGEVNYVHILTDNKSGQSKGMAFVVFRWHEDAAAALVGMDGVVLDKMVLHPEWAIQRPVTADKPRNPKKNGSQKKKKGNAVVG